MFEQLYPREMAVSVYDLDWERLAEQYQGVIFDIDNTLVPHGAPADGKAMHLFKRIHKLGIKTVLVSNNGEERVKSFAEQVGAEYVFKAGKPKKKGYLDAMAKIGTCTENTLFVGDQIFTDIWGANRAGLDTILSNPVDPSSDEIQIVLKRILEKPFRRECPKKGKIIG